MNSKPTSQGTGGDRREAAFALKELVAVIAVSALLFCVQLSAMIGSNNQTRVAQCAANVRQLTVAAINFTVDNDGIPPVNAGGNWAWDLPVTVVNNLGNYGAGRSAFYCPACPEQNADGLWNFGVPTFRVVGYALALPGTTTIASTNLVASIYPGRTYAGLIVPASQQVLVADATISQVDQSDPAQTAIYQFSGIQGGYTAAGWHGHRAAHLANNVPAGGNLGMIDGHVEWRSFTNMTARTAGFSSPTFWW